MCQGQHIFTGHVRTLQGGEDFFKLGVIPCKVICIVLFYVQCHATHDAQLHDSFLQEFVGLLLLLN